MSNARMNGGKSGEAVCPYCRKNDQVIPILYGYPSIEGFRMAERGEVYLGGCVVGVRRFFCKRDNREF